MCIHSQGTFINDDWLFKTGFQTWRESCASVRDSEKDERPRENDHGGAAKPQPFSPPKMAEQQDSGSLIVKLRPARQCLSHQVESAARLLHEQWPRGGSVEDYKSKLMMTGNDFTAAGRTTTTPSLPCSYLLIREAAVIAHGRLTECFEGAGGSAAAATYVIAEPRGCGYGSVLMELLEKQAVDLGYHYMYLWTASAVSFYQKIGYNQCERVSLFSPCLKKLECDQVSKLEAMLSKKLGTCRSSETVLPPPDEANNENDVWLRKRLVECVASKIVPLQQRLDEIRAATQVSSGHYCYAWEYFLIQIPWQQQVGPSCGLAALRMLRDHYLDNNDDKAHQHQMPSLLQEAVNNGYSVDGEIFDAANLVKLADFCGLDTVLRDFPTPKDIFAVLKAGGTIILPYDSQSSTKRPCKNQGRTAHYGIIVGVLFGFLDDNAATLQEYTNRCIDNDVDVTTLLLVQHGLSPKLTIATWSDFFDSNQQLDTIDKTKYKAASNVLNLKNRVLVCRGRGAS